MSQFRLIEPQQASPEAREMLTSVQAKLGRLPNLFKAMANAPATLEAYLSLNDALSRGSLSARLREQIALTVAERNGCHYCLAAHTAVGKILGLSDDEIINNRRAESSDQATSAALTFAGSLVDKRGAVSESDVEKVREAGFDDSRIAELVTTVVMNIFSNYFNLTAQTPIDFPKAQSLENENVKN